MLFSRDIILLTKGIATTTTQKPGSTTCRADITIPALVDSSMRIRLLPQGRDSSVTTCSHIVIITLVIPVIPMAT